MGNERIVSIVHTDAGEPHLDYHFYYHTNHLGSTNFVTLLSGERGSGKDLEYRLYEHIEYVPFGGIFIEKRAGNLLFMGVGRMPFYLFTGKEIDRETGLYYYGARYYDPKGSLWVSPDPIFEDYLSGSPNGGVYNSLNLNPYAYAHHNPVKYTDPSGEWVWKVVTVGIGGAIEVGLDYLDAKSEGRDYTFTEGIKSFAKGAVEELVNINPLKQLNKAKKLKKAIDTFKKLDKGTEPKGGTYKLLDRQTGKVRRTGRTNNLDRRKGEHRKHPETKELKFKRDRRTDDKDAQRGREQIIYDQHPEADLNKIRPIDPKNPKRDHYMRKGKELN